MLYSGGSAGGLAVYLHADAWAEAVPNAKFAAVPDSGFFLAYNATPGVGFGAELRWIFARMNATGGVPSACIADPAFADDPAACMFAENAAATLRAPVFAQQSTYDTWQIDNILHKKDAAAINAYAMIGPFPPSFSISG